MNNDFYLPTQIVFGCGSLERVGKLTAPLGKRVLLVHGAGAAARDGTVPRIVKLLSDAGLQVRLYPGVNGEADLAMVSAGLEQLHEHQADVVVGLGGGSAIDIAKAIAGLANQEAEPRAYHAGRQLERPGLALVAVPTTAGTGAEVTRNAVLIDPLSQFKTSIRGDDWFPRVALVDPELTLSMSASLTANTGSDALCQAIEAYTSLAANTITDSLAERAIQLLGTNLTQAFTNGRDLSAREAMSLGSLLAGMAMSNARLGAVHGIAHPLGAHFRIPHGLVCGLLLPAVMRHNLEFAVEKYARIAALLGFAGSGNKHEMAEQAVTAVAQLLHQVGIPQHLSSFGLRSDNLQLIIVETMPSGSTKHNARPLTEEDVRQILISAL